MTAAGLENSVEVALWLAIAIALVAGGWLFSRVRAPIADRAMAAAAPLLWVAPLAVAVGEFFQTFSRYWNDVRLAPAAGWVRGYPLYPGLDDGPLLGSIYGPLAAILYVPAVLFETPVGALATAELMTVAYFFGPPLVVLALDARRRGVSLGPTLFAGASFLLFALNTLGLDAVGFFIHADAPALCGMAVACAVLYFRREPGAWKTSLASALAVVLATATKQVVVPLAVALPLFCWIFEGRQSAIRYVASLAITGMAVGLALLLVVDVEAMLLNTIVVPGKIPWSFSGFELFTLGLSEIVIAGAPAVGLTAAIAGLLWREQRQAGREGSEWVLEQRWLVFWIAAAAQVPTSILGRAVVGGADNAITYALYLPLFALHLVLLRVLALPSASSPRVDRRVVRWAALGIALLLTVRVLPAAIAAPTHAAAFATSDARVGYAAALRYPGQIYFPRNPLISILAEGRAYHTEAGIEDRQLAKVKVGRRYLRAFLPEELRWVARPPDPSLPRGGPSLEALPGWSIEVAPEAAGSRPLRPRRSRQP